jgi:YHS domain-containing protein
VLRVFESDTPGIRIMGRYFREVRTMVRDPVCLIQMDLKDAEFTSEYRGVTYYFCCEDCKAEFDADSGAFSGRLAQATYGDMSHPKSSTG